MRKRYRRGDKAIIGGAILVGLLYLVYVVAIVALVVGAAVFVLKAAF